MARCVSCGAELHPERAEKYDYCTREECRARHARPATIASVGVNKASDQFVVLTEETRDEMARGHYQDPRRGRFAEGGRRPRRTDPRPDEDVHVGSPRPTERPALARDAERRPWTRSQQDQALALYHTGRKTPEEIARRLGLSERTVGEMLADAYRGRRA